LFLTLFLVPAMYVTTNRFAAWVGSLRAAGRERTTRQTVADGEPMLPRVPAAALND
jgi:hypothetical protein